MENTAPIEKKVTAAVAAAATVQILLWILEVALSIDIPVLIETAAATIAVFAAGWLAPHTSRPQNGE